MNETETKKADQAIGQGEQGTPRRELPGCNKKSDTVPLSASLVEELRALLINLGVSEYGVDLNNADEVYRDAFGQVLEDIECYLENCLSEPQVVSITANVSVCDSCGTSLDRGGVVETVMGSVLKVYCPTCYIRERFFEVSRIMLELLQEKGQLLTLSSLGVEPRT